MCSGPVNYKSYQQVLSLGPQKKRSPKPKTETVTTKRRTKSGCLTCRRRKKKCDEEKTGGKCQACIRNFLDCCWSKDDNEETKPKKASSVPETPEVAPVKMRCQTPTEKPQPNGNGASAYPSPVMSPKSEHDTTENKDVKMFVLPPSQYKVSKPAAAPAKKALKKALEAKFYIASFDSGKALCQVKN